MEDYSEGDVYPTSSAIEATSLLWNADFEKTFSDVNQDAAEEKHPTATAKSKRKPKRSSTYSEPFLQNMLENIQSGIMTTYYVEKNYDIPRSTLQYRLGKKFKNRGRPGPEAVLSAEEETVIVNWIQTMERRGFPITRHGLISKVSSYLRENPRPNPCRNNVPGRKWFERFMRRHPQITLRTPESVTSASAKVTEQDIRNWFQTVVDYLNENNLADALEDPSRILNGDETGFCMNSSPKKVLSTKGAKNVPSVETQNGKQNVTVLFSFAANGTVIPPDVILPYKRLSREIVQSFPADWGLGTSDTGWMNATNFALYIKKVLHPSLIKSKVKFPVLYFVDGHKSHTALEAADACSKLGIILIGLYPNATRIIQPADVSIFRPLKNSWGKVMEIWKNENMAERLTIPTFGSLLQEAIQTAFKKSTITSTFSVCGLYPFNPDAVDYSKCIAGNRYQCIKQDVLSTTDSLMDASNTTEIATTTQALATLVPSSAIEKALNMIGEERIKLFKYGDENNFSHEDKILATIYNDILRIDQFDTDKVSPNQQNIFEAPNDVANNFEETHGYPSFVNEDGLECELAESAFVTTIKSSNEDQSEYKRLKICQDVNQAEINGNNTPQNCEEMIPDPLSATKDNLRTPLSFSLENQVVSLENITSFELSNLQSELGNETDNDIYSWFEDDAISDEPDLEMIKDFLEDDTTCSPSLIPPAVRVNQDELDTGHHDCLPSSTTRSTIAVDSFFKAPPTPKRNPKHRNYQQKSYAILTAGERLEELRRKEINKAEAEKLKQQRSEQRKKNKILKETAANARAAEKENKKKTRDKKKEALDIARAEKEKNRKQKRKKELKKKQNETHFKKLHI